MKAWLIPSGACIEPFGCEVGAVPLGAVTLRAAQEEALAAAGATLVAPADSSSSPDAPIAGPALVLRDDLWVTRRALRGFVRACVGRRAPARLCLPRTRFLELTLPLQDLPLASDGRAGFELAFVPPGASATARELFALGPEDWVAPPGRELPLAVPVPRHILGAERATMEWPLTSTLALRVRHWLHVLRAGHFAPQVALLDRASASPLGTALRCLPALRWTREATLGALPRRLVFRGRGVVIHPSATVEASVLGDGVVVGAHAYVRNSVLGAGCVVEQRAHVNGCALGPRTFVSLNSSLSACVSFGDTDACINGVQACVFGARCALTSFARPLDLAPGGPVKVDDGGVLREVGELPCGAAFGPDVFLGADVVIAAGRAIPAGLKLVGDPARVLSRVPKDTAPGWYAVSDGTLKPAGG